MAGEMMLLRILSLTVTLLMKTLCTIQLRLKVASPCAELYHADDYRDAQFFYWKGSIHREPMKKP